MDLDIAKVISLVCLGLISFVIAMLPLKLR